MKRILLAAVALLSLDMAAAQAQTTTLLGPSLYETYSGAPFSGGLCAPAYNGEASPPSNACPNTLTYTQSFGVPNALYSQTGAVTAGGLIALTIPAAPSGQYWLMSISFQGYSNYSGTGDVWVPVLKGSGNSSIALFPDPTTDYLGGFGPATKGSPLGPTTEVVPFGTHGTGVIDGDITVGGAYTLAITDLLAPYHGALDTLPGALGYPGLNSTLPPDVPSPQISEFFLTVSLTAAPEPASLALLAGAATLLGAMRFRRRSQRASGTAA